MLQYQTVTNPVCAASNGWCFKLYFYHEADYEDYGVKKVSDEEDE